jgi:uncharacterized protein (DUF885 family)
MPVTRSLLFALLCCAATPALAQPSGPARNTASTASTVEDARLNRFLDTAYEERVALSPEEQTSLGRKNNYDRLDDYTEADRQRERDLQERQLRDLRAQFNPARLGPTARVSYDLFVRDVEQAREAYRFRWHRYALSNNGTPFGRIPVFLINNHRVDSVADAEAYVARLRDVERVMGEITARFRHQVELGIIPPAFNFEPVRRDARRILTGAPFGDGPPSAVFADFQTKVNALQIADSEKARLIAAARDALTGPFRRGYETLLAAWDEAAPRATANNGAWSLPEGAAYYEFMLRSRTTTNLTAQQIHQTGMEQLTRIHREMQAIMTQVGFHGTLPEFYRHILTDPQFRYSNDDAGRQAFLAEARAAVGRAMAAAPRYFRRLPRAPLDVRPVEAFRQATAAVAFYNQPSEDGSRPGIMYVNLGDMTQVLRPQTDDVSFHEGAPGHHFQIALAQEMEGLPKFRQQGFYGAYTEGWGLYSERLGHEMGLYSDPYQEFGRLAGEAWRAVRLVTDTGIHAMHWTREQAMQFFRDNTLLAEDNIRREVERYFNDPGQATSYMVGMLKILELRDKAQRTLGSRFDIRDFHAVILENGALPLDLLESQVDRYIAERRAH